MLFVDYQLEQEERARIDDIKEEERKKATEAIERWKENQKEQSREEQTSPKEEIAEVQEENTSATEVISNMEETKETQKTSKKTAKKKLQSHNKQQTNGMNNSFHTIFPLESLSFLLPPPPWKAGFPYEMEGNAYCLA